MAFYSRIESNLQKKSPKQPCVSLSVYICQDLEVRLAFDSPKINFTLFLDCFFSADCLQLYALALHAWRIEFFFKSHPIFTSDLKCRIRKGQLISKANFKPTKIFMYFCPSFKRPLKSSPNKRYTKFVGFLVQMKSLEFAFEIN